jgi:peptidoglycan-N-acetylglucosamine deacetylase
MTKMFVVRGVAVLLLGLLPSMALARSVSFTFDDGLNPDVEPNAREWNAQLLGHLSTAGVTAMVFPTLVRTGEGEGKELIRQWAAAGHAVGNHTARHRSLANASLSLGEFIDDVKVADKAYRDLPTWRPMLRFPYLKEGDTAEKRDGIRDWMRRNGYSAAPVSVDASDWYFNQVFLEWSKAGDQRRLQLLKREYLRHLLERASYYDGLARKVLGRSPKHVLLLHVNAINAAWLGDVVSAFRKQGWKVVSPQDAFGDALYATQPDVLPAGESIVWSLAKAVGVHGLRYPAEDSVYEAPRLKALGLIP